MAGDDERPPARLLGSAPGEPDDVDVSAAFKAVDSWWTVLAVDPLAARLLPPMVRRSWITPNRVTVVSGVLGLASGSAFLAGSPRTGAALYEIRFLCDCLDGKLARLRGTSSRYGHFLDIAVDFAGTAWGAVALGVWLARSGAVHRDHALLLLGATSVWAWSQAQRWSFAPPPGDDVDVDRRPAPAPASRLRAALSQRRLTRLPSSVEAETLALFLGPLTGSPRLAAAAANGAVLGFYAPSVLNNLVGTGLALWSAERGASGAPGLDGRAEV